MMKKIEWVLAAGFMMIGFICLIVSATSFPEGTFQYPGWRWLRISIMFGLFLLVSGSIYALIKWLRKR
ncbi:hypothetical protein [Paenibacillus faecalis]|uniref:hypothetical protein n=1 Tax=Paenibacillus faecalis TaxID=2079532 RepID=UPI000D0FFC1B|nr:hypothetical protein [Paenibacillus faecalis]